MESLNNRPLKSSEWVLNELKHQLEEGTPRPGDKLASVVDLAERFGVGRSTIREALSALKAMGLLDIRQGGGTYVKALPTKPSGEPLAEWMANAESLLHLVEVRRVLEAGNASLAARNRTEADLEALRATVTRMQQVLSDDRAGEQADTDFHLLLAEATHNPLLIDLTRSLSEQLGRSMKDTRALWFYADRHSAEQLLEEHEGILQAVTLRDERQASERTEKHLSKVEQVLREKLLETHVKPG
ncbi:MAG: GntR family transcriptional regulator [Cohnella sp.]|nr:GntR family transcriptional regulator [Cohnella sp.]